MTEPNDKDEPKKIVDADVDDPSPRHPAGARAAGAKSAEVTDADDQDSEDEIEESEEDSEEAVAADADVAPEEEKAVENRRERRRKKKQPLGDDAPVRDRNKRVRNQLTRSRNEERDATPLTTGEMVDDAFARGVAGAGKWFRQNSSLVQYIGLAAIVGGIAWGVYSWRSTSTSESSSADLMYGVLADRGRVLADAPPKKDDEIEILPTFKTEEQRETVALAEYRKVEKEHPSTGAASLARLGEAGILLDKGSWDESLAAYREIKASPLGNADPDVRGRSMEGIGFALEAKGDVDGAVKAFRELDSVAEKGFPVLALYHQARLAWGKGDKDAAASALKDAREKLKADPEEKNLVYLKNVIDELQRQVDPSAVPKAPPRMPSAGSGPEGGMSMEDLQKLQEQIKGMQEKAKDAIKTGSVPPPSKSAP